ncbi:TlpA family protein disulfide reductase [Sphingobacterium paucimobilis]|uniref:Thioredoxin domain-containing protein n=1 Tax=Sphingobacterium paucimobilis HER1398 TaxID=1346330 RepID=U2JF60_9SPHI|nr:TlpA disulfide reductase family protein [Sphingobacterium paucimobilis]ERJ61313.1 hypothetical protein M472_21395 [Sphingobacterium paucimobilis HER1398]
MKKFQFLIVAFLLISLFQTGYGQKGVRLDLNKALKVGDNFLPPDEVELMRSPDKTINWNKLDDKVIVLDFFETSCGSCIQSMPRLQALQNKLRDKMQIFTVGWQGKETFEKFFKGNAFLKENKVNLPVIYNDIYLKEKFPHMGVPHVAFIFRGKVKAITFSELITEENILQLFNTGEIALALKDDFGKGSLTGMGIDNADKLGIRLDGYQDGAAYQSLEIKTDSITGMINTSFYNVSIYSAILFNWARVRKADYIPRYERLILNVENRNMYEDFENIGNDWYTKNAISYERIDRVRRADSVQARIVLDDLHSFLGIQSYREIRKIDCLILRPCPIKPYKGIQPITGGYSCESTASLAVVIDLGYKLPPVLDRVKKEMKIRLGAFEDLKELNAQLNAYGIEAVLGEGEMEVLVIEEK